MRKSISAQSWASVPPAPGWMAMIAGFLSSAAASSSPSSVCSSLSARTTSCSSSETSVSWSCSSLASSSHSSRSSLALRSWRLLSMRCASSAFSCSRGVSFSGWSQAPGLESKASISARRFSSPSRSKTPPQAGVLFEKRAATCFQVRQLQHGVVVPVEGCRGVRRPRRRWANRRQSKRRPRRQEAAPGPRWIIARDHSGDGRTSSGCAAPLRRPDAVRRRASCWP